MKNKFQGALLGLAVGDALGGPLEFMSKNQIQIKHGVVSKMLGGGWLNLRPGQYTEDTILMLATAESLLEKKELDKKDLMSRYLEWFRLNPKDISQTTQTILTAVENGEEVEKAAYLHKNELIKEEGENDFLTRCIPLALYYFDNYENLMNKTMQAVMLTHYNKKMASGSVAVNLIIAHIINGETDKDKILEQTQDLLDENKLGLYNVLPDFKYKKKNTLRSSTHMQDTMETAIWIWQNMKNFKEAIIEAVNMGGDADTIGAVTGALNGAYYGVDEIPQEWLATLDDKNIINGIAKKIFKQKS